jgi:hypothetical protein
MSSSLSAAPHGPSHCTKELVAVPFPRATLISLVLDNLNTHTPAALCAIFAPVEAHRTLWKLDFHYTPTHGSWLSMAEVEWAVLSTPSLDQRLPAKEIVAHTLRAWETRSNAAKAPVH